MIGVTLIVAVTTPLPFLTRAAAATSALKLYSWLPSELSPELILYVTPAIKLDSSYCYFCPCNSCSGNGVTVLTPAMILLPEAKS